MNAPTPTEKICILLDAIRVDMHILSVLMGISDFEIQRYDELKEFAPAGEPDRMDTALDLLMRLGTITMSENGTFRLIEMSAKQRREFQDALRRAGTAHLARVLTGPDGLARLREAGES